ncbi:fibronectin type III domain-containing protein [Micromonospora cathayae]|uniref:Fibronectin type III domain-containing protein n=1 Tax=Micromonospora cathayae TaxID=3028804 RepID=A0ABY7ZYZ1_9ACTN|nr:fibronectin type III domain-containing protein [Micromonospora sp. HUAS 3]WDZ88279.1 fibronectin type III domain-containing protein [Micromonospora sp. HUAS 3]
MAPAVPDRTTPEQASEFFAPTYLQVVESRPAAYPTGEPESRGGRRLLVAVVAAAAVVVVVVLAGAAVLIVNVLNERTATLPPTAGEPAPVPVPTASFEPPAALRLRDDSTSIRLTWVDPSGGVVPFVVAGGRAGQPLGAMATLDPGRTSWTVNGLNPRVDYCFTVLAVYSTEQYATSTQVCTSREPRPSPS